MGMDSWDDDVWTERNTLFSQLAKMKNQIIKPSVEMLQLKVGGGVTLDKENCFHPGLVMSRLKH